MAKKNEKQKSAKEIQKELEERMFGMKNKKKNKEIKKQLEKIQVAQIMERKKKQQESSERITLIQPKTPAGVDPKTIPCVYFLNKMCNKGDLCKFMHEKKVIVQEDQKPIEIDHVRVVCKFMIDAISEGQLMKFWKCPNIECKDIHNVTEIGDADISIEDYIELSRQSLPEGLPLVSENMFNEWLEKRKHEQKMQHSGDKPFKSAITGAELFKENPECFVDDDEAADVDYVSPGQDEIDKTEEDQILKKFEDLDV